MERNRLLVTGDKPEEAYAFTFYPMADSSGVLAASVATSFGEEASASEYVFGIKQLGGDKMLKLRKDGYLTMSSVSDPEHDLSREVMAASLEYLRPCSSYEIVIDDKLV